MAEARFEKMSRSDRLLYGPEKLLLCGFASDAQPKLASVLKMAGLGEVGRVWAGADHRDTRLADLFELPADTGAGQSSALPRAIIVAGISERALHRLMDLCRRTGMKQALWAALTPTSETWSLAQLLDELRAERAAMSGRKKKK